ncbi:hypothetical protein [Sporomusa acidovorans]|uniref:Uncharacterized protein n=1 Tax=Sporomusa acidovorans (strain ATCC 49682 / DSM 3132 / Mol) TaxID=1123286 RepID=A0ABZ3J562_SPOA4|nr:hypothetical protein [Sporomusa acidovorans]OZC16371.1 hypothetical protein SPACI_42690 [Sporomusa acidovorans DSM 3132]SDF00652.1 hypothetical protein SAMN04488499_102949 [Sporomusa acidovorans]
MDKLTHKFKLAKKNHNHNHEHDHAPINLTDATVFSETYCIEFEKPVTKPTVEKMVTRLIQAIGRPLAHNEIIVGHIKVLAKLDEEFMFVSLTRMDRVDIKLSDKWTTDTVAKFSRVKLDINVLVFGYSKKVIAELVNHSLVNFRKDSQCEA